MIATLNWCGHSTSSNGATWTMSTSGPQEQHKKLPTLLAALDMVLSFSFAITVGHRRELSVSVSLALN